MTDQDAVQELEERFPKFKQELEFSSTLEDLDSIFFLRDMAYTDGVWPRLDRQICRRIVDAFFSWNNFLHRLIMPNPHSMFEAAEAGIFMEQDHEEMFGVMHKILAHCTKNNLTGIRSDKKSQGPFIDESVALWNQINPYLEQITTRIQTHWESKVED